MKLIEIIKNIENWAPKEIAWEKDNVGLQVGNTHNKVKNILICLDINEKVIEEALNKNCNLIISHHPLLFNPLRKIDIANDRNSQLIGDLIKNDITLYSAHTNLDYTKDGVSFKLAEKLGLRNISFLVNLKSNQYKLSVFAPMECADKIADAMFNAGGGIIGEYSRCSFMSKGSGTFMGSPASNPARGRIGEFVSADEVKLEIVVDRWKLNSVLSALKEVHPDEEPAYDLSPLHNPNLNYGIGATGELKEEMNPDVFLDHVSRTLNINNLRFTNGIKKKIQKVAVCGGSGSEYIKNAFNEKCDAFITADLKYHAFGDAEGKILLVDAGHYETEIFSLDEIKKRISAHLDDAEDIKVYLYSGSTNPVIFYNIKEK
jgi:dinuclear metal center YbgI/SA1388 family protein